MSHETKHWDGAKNKAIRWYFYQQRGLALINEFRYLAMMVFGVYVVAKLDNPVWLAVMFFGTMPVLILLGWLQVHHMAEVINWLDVQFGTYWTKRSMDWQERQVKAVEEIRDCVANPMRTVAIKPDRANRCATLGDQQAQAHEASGRGFITEQEILPIKIDKLKIGVY